MNFAELIAEVVDGTAVAKGTAEIVVRRLDQTIQAATAGGDKVRIPGFGSFQTKHRAGRLGRNPQTGEAIEIAPSTLLAFKPAKRGASGEESGA
ncbi:MAG: integration host factor subunit alpha [Candidatus Hydrogenedens sp.]|nr:integration host factor subunit alpha [Candidatus Hydrogenedens sp.]